MSQFISEQLLIEKEKVTKYLLNTDHPDGRSKAQLFIRHGFDPLEWDTFKDAIQKHAEDHPVISELGTLFGTKYIIEGSLETPSSKKLLIRSVWMIRINEQQATLITAYPI